RVLLGLTAGLALASLLWKVAVVVHVGGDRLAGTIPLLVLPAALDQFAVGMAVAILLVQVPGRSRLLSFAGRAPWLGALVAAAALIGLGLVWRIGPLAVLESPGWGTREILTHELKALLAAGLLLAAVCARPSAGAVGRVLGFEPLRRIGEISYGVYLWHLMILIVFAGAIRMGSQVEWIGGSEGLVGGWPGVAIAFAVTIAISAASWRLLERRLIARSHRRPR
ncbi:MAG: acyltransferase family protein, partial [Actinomycetes bacterium]